MYCVEPGRQGKNPFFEQPRLCWHQGNSSEQHYSSYHEGHGIQASCFAHRTWVTACKVVAEMTRIEHYLSNTELFSGVFSPMETTSSKRATLHRRQFHRRAALATSSLVVAANLGWAAPGKASRYVDMHTHLGQTWNSTETLSAEQLLRWMDAHDIAQAVVLPLVSPESSSYPLTADFVLAQTLDHRDRLIPFCSIDPRTSYKGGHQGLVAMLKKYIEMVPRGSGNTSRELPLTIPATWRFLLAVPKLDCQFCSTSIINEIPINQVCQDWKKSCSKIRSVRLSGMVQDGGLPFPATWHKEN